MQNSEYWTRITSVQVSQTSPVALYMQYSLISTRNTCLYWCQHSSVVSAFKTASFGAELQVSMGPKPHLSFCAWKTALLASELLVSIGFSPHLWFLDAQQRLLDQNNKSLWVPDIPCRSVQAKRRDRPKNHYSLWDSALICDFWTQNSQFKKSLWVSDLTCRIVLAKQRD